MLPDETPPSELLTFLARQLDLSPGASASYAERDETRREHLVELRAHYGLRSFGIGQYRSLAAWLWRCPHSAGIDELRRRFIVVQERPHAS